MAEPSLALQKLVRERLVNDAAVLALVSAEAILDRNTRPELDRMVIIGEGSTLFSDDYETFHEKAHLDLHIYVRETYTTGAKEIAGAIRDALRTRPWSVDGYVCHGLSVLNARYFRDPDGAHAHAVIALDAVLQRNAA
jgi:hypothetical protein